MLKKICKLCQKETSTLCWKGLCGPCNYQTNKSYWQEYYQRHKKPGKIREYSGCVICHKQIEKTRHIQAKTCSDYCAKLLSRWNFKTYYQRNKETLSTNQREKYWVMKFDKQMKEVKKLSSLNYGINKIDYDRDK